MALITTPTNIDYLITPLRVHISDLTEPHTYSDDLLRTTLTYGVKALMSRWNSRYLVNDTTNYIERNPNIVFDFPAPPIIQHKDERAIILQSSIDLKSSVIYNQSVTNSMGVSWKDDEISYSDQNRSVALLDSLKRDIEELAGLLPVGRQRLAQAKKQSLMGFINPPNSFEG